MYTNKMNKLTEFCFMMFLVTLAVMYFNTTIAKHLSWGAVVPLGYVLIWTKRVGTSDQGVVLRVFLNRVFLCSVSLKRFEWSTCVVQKSFFSKKSRSIKNYVIECFDSHGQHLL